jgi:hypothetical protein
MIVESTRSPATSPRPAEPSAYELMMAGSVDFCVGYGESHEYYMQLFSVISY